MRISDWSSDVCSSDLHPRRHHAARLPRPGRRTGLFRAGAERVRPRRRPLPELRPAAEAGADRPAGDGVVRALPTRSEEHTSELQSLMRISYAVFCLKKKTTNINDTMHHSTTQHKQHI